MSIFLTLLFKLIPLYVIILLGFIAGKFLKVRKESIASLLIYIIAPIIIFNGAVTAQISFSTLSLPILFFCLACFMCLLFYQISKRIWPGTEKNILAFTAGTGNTGYFGLPVAMTLFSQDVLSLVVLSILGFVLYENSLGFFITAKGQHTAKEALLKVIKLPTIYAFIIGIAVNLLELNLGQGFLDFIASFRGAYTVLGMMLIGLGIASIAQFKFDLKFTAVAFLSKFIVWPLLIALIIFLDLNYFKFYSAEIHKVMILMSVVPLASNTVAFATELKAQPEKASLAVLLSTIFALFYIPLVTIFYLS